MTYRCAERGEPCIYAGVTGTCVISTCAMEPHLITNGDRFREMTDEQLAELFFRLYRSTMESGGGDIAVLWCNGKAGCVDAEGEIECNEEKHRACILRWLKSEAKPEKKA